jgi:hypothetical protein
LLRPRRVPKRATSGGNLAAGTCGLTSVITGTRAATAGNRSTLRKSARGERHFGSACALSSGTSGARSSGAAIAGVGAPEFGVSVSIPFADLASSSCVPITLFSGSRGEGTKPLATVASAGTSAQGVGELRSEAAFSLAQSSPFPAESARQRQFLLFGLGTDRPRGLRSPSRGGLDALGHECCVRSRRA